MKRRRNKTKLRQDQVYGTVNVGEDRTLTLYYYPQTDEVEIVDAEKDRHELSEIMSGIVESRKWYRQSHLMGRFSLPRNEPFSLMTVLLLWIQTVV
jgi:hypothetical protein